MPDPGAAKPVILDRVSIEATQPPHQASLVTEGCQALDSTNFFKLPDARLVPLRRQAASLGVPAAPRPQCASPKKRAPRLLLQCAAHVAAPRSAERAKRRYLLGQSASVGVVPNLNLFDDQPEQTLCDTKHRLEQRHLPIPTLLLLMLLAEELLAAFKYAWELWALGPPVPALHETSPLGG